MSTNHAELGARMAEHWGFPQPLIKAIEGLRTRSKSPH
ncbi:MAG: HDOD domain-containing protein [Desulfuromonadaceae bacterium]|nr:HDOD domain-containing protein [Desulfuromonadaceae bacterium]